MACDKRIRASQGFKASWPLWSNMATAGHRGSPTFLQTRKRTGSHCGVVCHAPTLLCGGATLGKSDELRTGVWYSNTLEPWHKNAVHGQGHMAFSAKRKAGHRRASRDHQFGFAVLGNQGWANHTERGWWATVQTVQKLLLQGENSYIFSAKPCKTVPCSMSTLVLWRKTVQDVPFGLVLANQTNGAGMPSTKPPNP